LWNWLVLHGTDDLVDVLRDGDVFEGVAVYEMRSA
jgi:hypothetical protein